MITLDNSENNNREMWILILKNKNEEMYKEISKEANSIIQSTTQHYIKNDRLKTIKNHSYANTVKI